MAKTRVSPRKPAAGFGAYWRLMRFDKPVGTLLLLWPTLWALWLAAGGLPAPKVLAIFVAGVVVMRAAGCVINDFADRKVDGQVKRTKARPLATGQVSPQAALALFGLLLLLALALVLMTNPLTFMLSFGALALASVYPFMKRHTHLPQVFLGAAFAWSTVQSFGAGILRLRNDVFEQASHRNIVALQHLVVAMFCNSMAQHY